MSRRRRASLAFRAATGTRPPSRVDTRRHRSAPETVDRRLRDVAAVARVRTRGALRHAVRDRRPRRFGVLARIVRSGRRNRSSWHTTQRYRAASGAGGIPYRTEQLRLPRTRYALFGPIRTPGPRRTWMCLRAEPLSPEPQRFTISDGTLWLRLAATAADPSMPDPFSTLSTAVLQLGLTYTRPSHADGASRWRCYDSL